MPASPSTSPEPAPAGVAARMPDDAWAALPTETDIYLLPDGRVVIADLPAELTDLAHALGRAEPCAVSDGDVNTSSDATPQEQ